MAVPKKYKHLRSIGDGYFATVSRYQDVATKQECAIKCLKTDHQGNPDYRFRFLREIALLKDLAGHPHIIDLIDHEPDENEPQLWYAMPVAMDNLFNYIRRNNQTLTREDRIALFEGVLIAVSHAHSLGILHRDLGPHNVLMFEDEGQVWTRISDFGLGKDIKAINYTRTSVGGFGQFLYMSPEQRDHLKDADEKSDIHALGNLLYFVMTGRDPKNIRDGDFYTVIRKAIEERPEDRYQTIEEMTEEFNSVKSFLLDPGIPLAKQSMKEYLENRAEINWTEFHEVALVANSDDHTYHDYVGPVTFCLLEKGNLEAYYAAKKGDFLRFVDKYNDAVCALPRITRWPFKALDDFGYLNYRIYRISTNNEVKFSCLKQIWEIAWAHNQFAIQKSWKDLFSDNTFPKELESRLAQHMIANSRMTTGSIAPFLGTAMPSVIKRAIQQLQKEKEP
jgi:eukaryotic-like serine/threonine-protein kinase